MTAFLRGLCCVALLLGVVRAAQAMDTAMPWNLKKAPALGRAQALHLADRFAKIRFTGLRRRSIGLVATNEQSTAGEWRIVYVGPQKRAEEVVVAFRGKGETLTVEVQRGALNR